MATYHDLYEQDDSAVTSTTNGGLGMTREEARSVPAARKRKKKPTRLSAPRKEVSEPNIGYYETKNP